MRIVLLVFISIFLYANEADNALQKAQEYEAKKDMKNAFFWYKKAANLALNKSTIQEVNLFATCSNESEEIVEKKDEKLEEKMKQLPEITLENIKKYKAKNEFFDNYILPDINKDNEETIKEVLMSAFGVEPHETNYLLPATYDFNSHDGRKRFETKFQISFKKELLNNFLGFHESLNVGYTQTSFWQTAQHSSPFRESNYMPEIFLDVPYLHENTFFRGFRFGLIHQSNGRDKEFSRSWNRFYLTGFFQHNNLFIAPKIWYRLPEQKKKNPTDYKGDDNPDIKHFLGYGDLTIAYPYKTHLFKLMLRNNFKKDNKGAIEFNWSFPLFSGIYGYLQYFNGYGESMIDYNKKVNKIGIGFAVSR